MHKNIVEQFTNGLVKLIDVSAMIRCLANLYRKYIV